MESLITANIRSRPTRTFISVLAVALGVVLMLVIGGITSGTLKDYVGRTIGIGADFILQPAGSTILFAFSGAGLSEKLAGKARELPGISDVAPVLAKFSSADFNILFGIDLESYNKLPGRPQIISGRDILGDDDIIVDELFARSHRVGVGSSLTLLNHTWKVVAICRPGSGVRAYVPLKTLQILNGEPEKVTMLFIKAGPNADLKRVAAELHEAFPGYTLTSTKDESSLLSGTAFPGLKQFRFTVVLVSMLISFMVILLAMYTTIFERTREIGILKSIGASRGFIVAMILKESVIICCLGVLLGIAVSAVAREVIVTAYPTLQVAMTSRDILNGCALGLLGGTLGALYPAYKAARMDPVRALSYE